MSTRSCTSGPYFRRSAAALLVLLCGLGGVHVAESGADPAPPALPGIPALPPVAPAPTGPPGALFGAYVQGESHTPDQQLAAVETRERDIGRRLAIDHHFYP